MAANTKYTPAPTRDPEENEHGVYTQAPPSYQEAGSSSAQDEARLFGGGAPRASQDGDDIPDDFKVRGANNSGSSILPLAALMHAIVYYHHCFRRETLISHLPSSSVAPSLKRPSISGISSSAKSTPF